jgi:hypothetical protein
VKRLETRKGMRKQVLDQNAKVGSQGAFEDVGGVFGDAVDLSREAGVSIRCVGEQFWQQVLHLLR